MANTFDTAKTAYQDCINDLTVMGIATEYVMAKYGKSFSTRILLNKFDVLLQYSLLEVSHSDGSLAYEEICFIRDLTKYCQFPEYLKTKGYANAIWQMIYNTQEQKLKSILKDLRRDVLELSSDFINIFSSFDTAAEYNYL